MTDRNETLLDARRRELARPKAPASPRRGFQFDGRGGFVATPQLARAAAAAGLAEWIRPELRQLAEAIRMPAGNQWPSGLPIGCKTRRALRKAGIPMMSSQSHIIPVPVGDPLRCREASTLLLERFAIYVQPINYPTVPKGTERLRITPTPFHNDQLIDDLACALREVWNGLRLPRETNVVPVQSLPRLKPAA